MKAIFHKIFALSMALLLLLSIVSWKVEKHYCMGRLIDVALFAEAESCGMDALGFDQEEGLKQVRQSCCDDEVIIIDGQDELHLLANDLEISQQSFFIAFAETNYIISLNLAEQPLLNEYYPPPIIVTDIQLLDQVFLI
jgi:hypothetical protein